MMRNNCRLYILALLLCAISPSADAQEDGNAWSVSLDSITVKGYRNKSQVKTDVNGMMLWDMSSMSLLPQLLGNADPVHYAQMLPGIQTNSEYRSGINIEGCDNQHNVVSIDGVPIYNVNHLLGFFSTFNSPHYHTMSIAKGIVSAASSNRLGGQLDMLQTTERTDTISGQISLGLISSQGTVCLPVNSKTTITTSLRYSYINLLYSKWLNVEEQQIHYTFYDANISLVHHLNKKSKILLDFYCGSDDATFSESRYLVNLKTRWGNTMGAAHWLYGKGDLSIKTTAYISSYRNKAGLDIQDMAYRLPSSITDLALKSDAAWRRWSVGFETIWHNIHPQTLERKGSFNISEGKFSPMHSLETSFYGNYVYPLTEHSRLSGGIRTSLFNKGSKTYGAIDPSLRLLYDNQKIQLSVSYAHRVQYLFQTGFSDFGLPTEFWISASEDFKPQSTHELSLNGSSYLFNRKYKVSVYLFYRRLYHQLGYKGSILDYVNMVYDVKNSLMHGKGENYGFSLMLNKCSGPLNGWMSYTFTHARRSFDETGRNILFPANHERPHEINTVATYTFGKHWIVGSSLVYASGTPFTAANTLYLLNNNLVIKYDEYNAARLHPYFRLDLSTNYKWGKNNRHGVNLSFYNVTCRDNELYYYLKTNDEGAFVYRPVTFIMNILPSISYYYKF